MLGAEATGSPSDCCAISASYLGAGKLNVGHTAAARKLGRQGGDGVTSVLVFRDDKDEVPIFSGNYQCMK